MVIKRTLFFTRPAYLHTRHEQLVVEYPDAPPPPPRARRLKDIPEEGPRTVPIEEIGFVILEHGRITLTNRLVEKLMESNAVIVHCNSRHLPFSMTLPMVGHTEYTRRLRLQLESSVPLRKNLWKQTVQAKILNQAGVLEKFGKDAEKLRLLARKVTSGDRYNEESKAAVYYWSTLFAEWPDFIRHRDGPPPNALLNYGYAILRAVAARALVGSGLLPALGIHHQNKYNPYCLADDIMEPYRPFVDALVFTMFQNGIGGEDKLTPWVKQQLAQVPVLDVLIEGKRRPLMVAMSRTTNSLYECFAHVSRKMVYPSCCEG